MRLIIIIAVEQDNWAIIAYKQLSCKMLDQIQDGNLKLEVIIIYIKCWGKKYMFYQWDL